MAYPVADALLARAVPCVFTTGSIDGDLETRYPEVARCEKPLAFGRLLEALARLPHASDASLR